ncbi:MAG: TusE/DsrC/DsvC family sulfur relay protein [Pseudomonadales bacterium]|nr:TusE/DsrC/DsvC family sulfur relay protein [Pseudomonadales bacterium]
MVLTVHYARDSQGYLIDLNTWNETIAESIAKELSIELGAPHWEIVYSVRAYYQRFDSSPASRALSKWLGIELGKEKGSSLYLMSLFPGKPALSVAKIAGLPRPTNCL